MVRGAMLLKSDLAVHRRVLQKVAVPKVTGRWAARRISAREVR